MLEAAGNHQLICSDVFHHYHRLVTHPPLQLPLILLTLPQPVQINILLAHWDIYRRHHHSVNYPPLPFPLTLPMLPQLMQFNILPIPHQMPLITKHNQQWKVSVRAMLTWNNLNYDAACEYAINWLICIVFCIMTKSIPVFYS